MICFDANVILEVVLERERAEGCRGRIEKAKADQGENAISTLTFSHVMYYAEARKLNLKNVELLLGTFSWLPVLETDVAWARSRYQGKDFEDALQIACALREGCTKFVTLDQKLAKKYAGQLSIELIR